MIDSLLALIVDESKWLPACMSLAALMVGILWYRQRSADLPVRRRVLAAMNLFFAVTIGAMVFGHLLAVTTKLALGTLEGSALLFYGIGVVLAVPVGWLFLHTRNRIASGESFGRKTLVLNAWLGATLLALGLHNLPLAVPAVFNIGYQVHSRKAVGWAIVSLVVVLQVGLFIGALMFLASGQSFEEFRGLE